MHSQNPHPPKSLRGLHLHLRLPEEIIEEILSRLPVRSLLRFRCVSKSWLSLIKSDKFINKHLKNSTKNTSLAHHRAMFYSNVSVTMMNGFSLHSLLNSKKQVSISSSSSSSSSISIIDDQTSYNLPKAGEIVGCCNGVLCILSKYTYPNNKVDFWLWNPATKALVGLQLLGCLASKYGFGWDESSGAFKVFAAAAAMNKYSGKVYSSKTKSWKTVPLGCGCLCNRFGVFVRGRLHWSMELESGEHAIDSFDLERNEFGVIELPATLIPHASAAWATWLGEIGGCLCCLFDFGKVFDFKNNKVDVWVMKEYGVKDSWFKLLTFAHVFSNPRTRMIHGLTPLFGEAPNGEIFIIYRNAFVSLSLKGNGDGDGDGDAPLSIATNVVRYCRACIYVESLVSP